MAHASTASRCVSGRAASAGRTAATSAASPPNQATVAPRWIQSASTESQTGAVAAACPFRLVRSRSTAPNTSAVIAQDRPSRFDLPRRTADQESASSSAASAKRPAQRAP